MRKIEFHELKLKNTEDANMFYQSYLQTFQKPALKEDSFQRPSKQYEICYLNILDGKLVLLNKDYIEKFDISNQELFFDYSLALTIYSLMLDIQDGILDEKQECNELYKEERLKKEEEIELYKKKDELLFQKALEDYEIISHSALYQDYRILLEEYQKLKQENELLLEKCNTSLILPTAKAHFFDNIRNKITTIIRRNK